MCHIELLQARIAVRDACLYGKQNSNSFPRNYIYIYIYDYEQLHACPLLDEKRRKSTYTKLKKEKQSIAIQEKREKNGIQERKRETQRDNIGDFHEHA